MAVSVYHPPYASNNPNNKFGVIGDAHNDVNRANHRPPRLSSSPDPSLVPLPDSPGPISLTIQSESTQSFFHILPIELIILIFSFCIDDDADAPAILTRVCRQWREIMNDLPSLWSRLRLSDICFNAKRLQAKVELWASRRISLSRNQEPIELPLDIDLDTRYRDSVIPLLSYIIPTADRWNVVSYMFSRMRLLFTKDATKANLQTLLVTLTPRRSLEKGDLSDSLSSPSPRAYWGGREDPTMKDFSKSRKAGEHLKEIYVLGVRCLPTPEVLLPFTTVTMLVLMNSSTECDFPMHQVVPFLGAFPALELLEMANFNELFRVLSPEYRPNCQSIEPAVLPYLKRINVRGICSSRCLFSHLYAPRLETLVIVHVNSSRRFDHPLPGEPGDSDDEAHDFSRSPWTDHATGMGLRKMFAYREGYNEPVLRELIMDYADLRTKDFKWLFSRLTRLEKFHIVASDMSDNVIRALTVDGNTDYCPPSAPNLECAAAPIPILPKLTQLRLAKCQRISGSEILRMVASRITAAAHKRTSPIEELIITRCSGVTPSHHRELQSIFPENGRLTYAHG
ncbi:hypothetical protein PNOK_0755000 [Pyrrhoderma noxium]|uniref:F-box domain-containing protein n=1 Tax=Pyrrhoderma noxium TaxID=2282107 RepID=A0A286UD15_9AGAM|nr:hypothetical protein PNOK_0755000 [Pyrrhoderma noxium]